MSTFENELTWADLGTEEQRYLLALSVGMPFQDTAARVVLHHRRLLDSTGVITPAGWLVLRGRP